MEHPIQRIVQDWGGRYVSTHRAGPHIWRAVQALCRCKTASLGGHVKRCPEGHVVGVWYNGCGHRSCPRCGWRKTQAWLARRVQELLPCDHYHAVFTVPSELRGLWVQNPKELPSLLFAAVSETLLMLLGSARGLGVLPGVTLTLHTWAKTLVLHPHVHALVTGGGLTPAGEWRGCREGFLLPVRMMTQVFRGKLLKSLERAIRKGQLRLPAGMDQAGALAVLRAAARVKWSVWVAQRYPHGRGVMRYLSGHLRGGPLHDGRIVTYDGATVRLALRDEKTMDLPAEEFVGRLLQHVPVRNLRVVRHYGLYAHTQREARERARSQLPAPAADAAPSAELAAPPSEEPERCPQCGAVLIVEVFPRGGSPPTIWRGLVAA